MKTMTTWSKYISHFPTLMPTLTRRRKALNQIVQRTLTEREHMERFNCLGNPSNPVQRTRNISFQEFFVFYFTFLSRFMKQLNRTIYIFNSGKPSPDFLVFKSSRISQQSFVWFCTGLREIWSMSICVLAAPQLSNAWNILLNLL